ncbi:Ni, Fe-hydrogenase maturation factor [Candidatus Scalindua japonica]|uniref:Ni, Fe-hydrogenase maturation factor n=1 Tax=Candidatus Scalindua japonica TaxID=1284222 RepID=A0A286TVH8_9BACT|nr:HyaD/HybD family hydrogenase maturation endopeptidase [Candidatus Scalindua japonica]GAX59841.1 Ni, Fe-hydrogenase maturation factor [Candidatus Scalindua japonica]
MNDEKRIVVIGIGNLLLMDEGIGIHTINELERCVLHRNVTIYDGGTGGFKLIDLMQGADKVIFIDAIETGKSPGTIISFKSEEVKSLYRKKKYSLHDTDILEVIKMTEFLDNPPEIQIVGIQPKIIDYGTILSKELSDAMPDIINSVLKEIKDVCRASSV